MMPRRKKTRATQRAQAIADERRHNRERREAAREARWARPTSPVPDGDDPPPF